MLLAHCYTFAWDSLLLSPHNNMLALYTRGAYNKWQRFTILFCRLFINAFVPLFEASTTAPHYDETVDFACMTIYQKEVEIYWRIAEKRKMIQMDSASQIVHFFTHFILFAMIVHKYVGGVRIKSQLSAWKWQKEGRQWLLTLAHCIMWYVLYVHRSCCGSDFVLPVAFAWKGPFRALANDWIFFACEWVRVMN